MPEKNLWESTQMEVNELSWLFIVVVILFFLAFAIRIWCLWGDEKERKEDRKIREDIREYLKRLIERER